MKSTFQVAQALAAISGALFLAHRSNADVFTATPVSDAFVAAGPTGNLRNNNYGGGGALALAAPGLSLGEFQSVIQFDLSGARNSFNAEFGAGNWSIQSLTLRLSSSPHNNAIYNNIAAGQFNVSLMQNSSWTEGTGTASVPTTDGITFNSLQSTFENPATDQALGTFSFGGGSSGANSYPLTVSPGAAGDLFSGSSMSLRLFAADSQVSYLFTSRSGSSQGPELIIDATPVPEPGSLMIGSLVFGVAVIGRRLRHRG